MCFDDLGVKIPAELFGSFLRQPEEHIDSDAEIRCQHDRQRLRGFFNYFALLPRLTGRPNHQRLVMFQATRQISVMVSAWLKSIATSQFCIAGSIESPRSHRAGSRFPVAIRKIADGFSHATGRANQQSHARESSFCAQPAIVSIRIPLAFCASASDLLRSSRIVADALRRTSRRASQGLFLPEQDLVR